MAVVAEVRLPQVESTAVVESARYIPFPESGAYPVRAGNLVRPLVDSGPAFRRICAAIEAARHSVWVTIAFIAPDFQMPDGRGSLFDVLDRAAERGLDVQVIFWRPNPESSGYGQTFPGSRADHELLGARGSRFRARWDRAQGVSCQHQKSWLIDAGRSTETAFIGGINLTFKVFEPGHTGEGQRHDVYVEVAGPSASDVHHNFAQRWNEASEHLLEDGAWGHDGNDDLAFPSRASAERGKSLVQIQRTVHAGQYGDGRASPGGQPYDIAGGERAIFEQYLQAIDAARRAIYIENQTIGVEAIVRRLDDALKRGVEVVVLVPGNPEGAIRADRRRPERKGFFDLLASLARHPRFALVGIAGSGTQDVRHDVYIHAKIMLIDDAWATIGSCNLHGYSLFGQSEMNASFWDPDVARALRCALLAEHLGQDTRHLDDRSALGLYRQVARENRVKRDRGDAKWQGLAFTLDPATYGE